MPDVFKILKDLELKAVGLDPETNKMQEGYFVAFRNVGLPIHKDDFDNPWSPLGANLKKNIEEAPVRPAADPKDAPTTASGSVDETKVFTANIARSQQTYLNGFLLTDDKLRLSHQYTVMPGSSKVSDSWWAIITGANGVPIQSELSAEMKAAYEAAKAKLMDAEGLPTAKYQAYMERQDEYRDAVRSYYKAYAAAFTDPMRLQAFPMEGKLYKDEVDEAWDRWVSFGAKNEIEGAIATLAAQGTDPAIALISRCKKRFEGSLSDFVGIGQIPYTMILPESWYDSDNDDGWTEYGSRDFHTESHYSASGTSYGGGGGFNVGFFSVGGSFSKAEEQESLAMQTSNLEVGFKYAVADIKRPWLDTSLLNLRNWFLMGDYKKGTISNGTMGQELPDQAIEPTFLPSIVTGLIFIKDLSIKWDDWKSQWSKAEEKTSGGGSVGYGPFAVSGSYSHHEEKRDFVADSSGEFLRVPGIQLIGYVSTINPMAPGLDSADFLEPAGAGEGTGTAPAGGADGGAPADAAPSTPAGTGTVATGGTGPGTPAPDGGTPAEDTAPSTPAAPSGGTPPVDTAPSTPAGQGTAATGGTDPGSPAADGGTPADEDVAGETEPSTPAGGTGGTG